MNARTLAVALFALFARGFAQEPAIAARAPSQVVCTLAQNGVVAEGLAYDAKSERYFVGSVRERAIFRVASDGALERFSSSGDGLFGVFGMKIDSAKRRLFACTSRLKEMGGEDASKPETGGVVEYDLDTRALVRKVMLADDGARHVLGDLELAQDGTVYASDSLAPIVFVLKPNTSELVRAFESADFKSLQGLALNADGTRLIVSDYSRGIESIELASKKCTLLALPPNRQLAGIDGLYRRGNEWIGVYNGDEPCAIVRFRIAAAGDAIESLEFLEHSDALHDLTLGVVVEDQFVFISKSGWAEFDAEHQLAPPERRAAPVLRRLKL